MGYPPNQRLDTLRGTVTGEGYEDVQEAVENAYEVLCERAKDLDVKEENEAELKKALRSARLLERIGGVDARAKVEATDTAYSEAEDHGIPICAVKGTGEDGRVVVSDVRSVIDVVGMVE